ncbi:MAG TPA: DUF6398 domain-containing protein [Roseiflexaceae bacterium]|nr:DUF6398 domain-containing protein [Roseiflexaceae bacterium]
MSKAESVPKQMQPLYDQIVAITDAFCHQHLNDEYAQMCRKLAAALSRKRPSPLARGRVEIWGCGIVYAIGSVNFLSDRSFEPYMPLEEVCALMGVSKSTGANKAGEIRKIFGMYQFDPNWTLPSLMDENPMAWMITVNGLIVDARHVPRQIQEEAFRKGLIPYIPGEPGQR